MIIEEDIYLEHYGVKGMRWGHRKSSVPGVHPRTAREARKDAEEHARAKMYYGKGAGTRRKLIKAKVESRAAQDPAYRKAFEHHLRNQDLGDHASKATRQRKRTDRVEGTKKTAGVVAREVTGHPGTRAAFLALGVSGAAYLNSPGGRVKMKKATNFAKNHADEIKRRNGARKIKKFLK